MDTLSQKIDTDTIAALKKKRLWRNIFLLNLCVTIFLIGIFWVPLKVLEVGNFFASPSVNLPKKGRISKMPESTPAPVVYVANLLAPRSISINASSEDDWVYFDFSRDAVVNIHDPSSLEWDLAFRRGKVITNGGATNRFGSAGANDLGAVAFGAVAEAPAAEYTSDSATRTETENKVLKKWYKYNYLSHKLTAKKNVFAVRTAKGKYAKVQFLSFYCENRETGCIKMRYVFQESGSNQFAKTPGSS